MDPEQEAAALRLMGQRQREKDVPAPATEWQRFTASEFSCPQCGKPALEDHSSPNYGSSMYMRGMAKWSKDGNHEPLPDGWTTSAYVKHVCWDCKIQFGVSVSRIQPDNGPMVDNTKTVNIRPLVERDGKLLTDSDVWMEDYKAEHGEYPVVAYG